MHHKLFLHRLLLTCLMMLTSLQASAGYVVEMVVFEPTTTQGWLDEYWPLLPAKIDTPEKNTLLGANANNRRLLSEGQFSLKETAKNLTSTGAYRITAHTAWSQPSELHESAYNNQLPDNLSRTGLPIQANIKLYKQKFEHIDIEIQLERAIPKGLISEFAQKHNLSVSDVGDNWRFRLQESRKIKLTELQYFDHPMFGILLIVKETGN